MIKVHLIIGARPNIMKIGPLFKELQKHPNKYQAKIIHTGQHYDERMSELFFKELSVSEPDFSLNVGSASHGEQTARIMEKYEEVVLTDKPDLVVVAGDVNSTMACTLVAVKLSIPVAHLEAGLRSNDRSMPEEINRIITDSVCDLLLTPSEDADVNLINEGVDKSKIKLIGNIMIDSLIHNLSDAMHSTILNDIKLEPQSYCLVTMHRPSNVDNKASMDLFIKTIKGLTEKLPVVIPLHPRTEKNLAKFGYNEEFYAIHDLTVLPPVGYHDMLKLEMNAKLIVTDSGGLQEESTYMGIPCLTVRENTERPITITEGTNKLTKLDPELIFTETDLILSGKHKEGNIPDLWDGNTAQRVVAVFDEYFLNQ